MHTIIGIDCATRAEKTGIALARLEGAVFKIDEVKLGSKQCEPMDTITSWVKNSLADHRRVMIALDAPLGWPTALGGFLCSHQAGAAPRPCANRLFRRHTDDEIERRLGKRPLEVGANLIARTAYAALGLLEELRQRIGLEIPLAWNAQESNQVAAIEVYPAATLLARKVSDPANALEALQEELGLAQPQLRDPSPHARDAALCALAGADFLLGMSVPPDDLDTAKKEGWIWAPDPQA